MELDKALEFAVIVAWEDLMKASQPCPIRVQYQGDPGMSLDNVSVWSSKVWGYHDLVCDYSTSSSPGYPSGVRFKNGYGSDTLAENLGFVMKNQDQFTRPADAARNGLVLIDPPVAGERKEAASWMKQFRDRNTHFGKAAD